MVYECLVNYFHMFPSISLMFDVELNKRPQVPFRTLMSYLKFGKISTILITLIIAFLIGINPALEKLDTKAVDRGWLIQHNYKQREQRSTAKVLVLWMFSSGSLVQMCPPSSGYEVKKPKVNETNGRGMLNCVNPLFSWCWIMEKTCFYPGPYT